MLIRLAQIILIAVSIASAQSDTGRVTVPSIIKYVADIDSLIQRNPKRLEMFAKIHGKTPLVVVRKGADWPEETEVSYNVFRDRAGHVVYFCETPTSESGDWNMVCEHYFNSDGDVLLYRYFVSGFNSDCTEILRQEFKLFFDSNFNLIGKESALTDKDFKPISAEGCEFNYKFPFQVYPEIDDLPSPVRQALKIKE